MPGFFDCFSFICAGNEPGKLSNDMDETDDTRFRTERGGQPQSSLAALWREVDACIMAVIDVVIGFNLKTAPRVHFNL